MSSSKRRPVKGLCGRCLSEFIDWGLLISCILSVMLLFSTHLCDLYSHLLCGSTLPPTPIPWVNIRYTHKTSGFKTSGFKTSETSGLQNVRFTKCQVYKTSGLQNVRLQKTSIYILYLWLVEICRFCCSHVCRQSDGCVLFSILEGFFAIYHHNR
jgi:hypothetical protein